MITFDELYEIVKSKLSEERFNHTLGVVKRAEQYASIHGENIEKARLVALAHDMCKEISKDKRVEEAKKIGYMPDEIEEKNTSLLHGKIAGMICKNEFGFDDDMVNAVMYHTTGRENMSKLEKIIFLADATEEGRGYDDIDYYVSLSCVSLDKAMFAVTKWCIDYVIEKESYIHLDSIKCYNFYKE